MKKFELTTETKVVLGKKVFRIKAMADFGTVKNGELGGFVEKEENLSHEGDAWVFGNASVSGDASVFGDAWVFGDARVFDDASVSGDARVSGDAWVFGNARVFSDAWVFGDARVSGNDDYATATGFGSENRTTTFFRQKDESIGVRCGCFYGTIDDFKGEVIKTHGDTKYAKEYLEIADLMEMHFNDEVE